MERCDTGARLIIVCGLPGSGKTTLSKMLERRLRAVRLCPDEWLDALSISLYREDMRGKVEALQWKLAQDLLVLGLTVIIEWGTGQGPSGIPYGWEPELLGLLSSCTLSLRLRRSFLTGSNAAAENFRL